MRKQHDDIALLIAVGSIAAALGCLAALLGFYLEFFR